MTYKSYIIIGSVRLIPPINLSIATELQRRLHIFALEINHKCNLKHQRISCAIIITTPTTTTIVAPTAIAATAIITIMSMAMSTIVTTTIMAVIATTTATTTTATAKRNWHCGAP